MDQILTDLINQLGDKNLESKASLSFVDRKACEIEIKTQTGVTKYTLKPLEELYGAGYGFSSVDPKNNTYMPLLQRIEETLWMYWDSGEELTDGLVTLTLDRLGGNPSCIPGNDLLCQDIQTDLRLLLSFNTYSKQEVKQACRVISKSVQRHTKIAGTTGYLEFIERMFNRE